MESFEWDPEKRKANIEKHGLDFVRASHIFDGQVHQYSSKRGHEERWVAVGLLDGEEIAVIYTLRGPRIRIISARKARRHEKRAYRALFPR